jgi:hypothetical protein
MVLGSWLMVLLVVLGCRHDTAADEVPAEEKALWNALRMTVVAD